MSNSQYSFLIILIIIIAAGLFLIFRYYDKFNQNIKMYKKKNKRN